MYLIVKHMCRSFKSSNSSISLFCVCESLPILFLASIVPSLRVTCSCDAGFLPHHLWNYSNEDTVFLLFTALNGDTETRLEYSWTPFLTLMLRLLPPLSSLSLHLSLSLCESCRGIGGTSRALWEAINECVAWRVVMRGILQPFIRAGRHLTGGQPTGCVII